MFQLNTSEDWTTVFAHIDADCFYVSCEVARNPSLKNRDIVVGNDIVLTKSYSAKAKGIYTGMPVWEARRVCKKLIILKPDIEYYGKISERLFSILKQFSPEMEVYSIDEAFLNIKGCFKMAGCSSYKELANKIKTIIEVKLNITVSIGISVNRLLSKLASESNKPNGIMIVAKDQITSFLNGRSIGDICGIGPASQKKLKDNFILSIDKFLKTDIKKIQRILGKKGVEIYYEMTGLNVQGIQLERKKPKSIIKSRSFHRPISDVNVVKAAFLGHIENAVSKLKYEKCLTKKILVLFRYKNFRVVTYEIELEEYSNSSSYLKEKLLDKFNQVIIQGPLYRSTGVIFTNLQDQAFYQLSLTTKQEKYEKLDKLNLIRDKINKKYGAKTVLFGAELAVKKNIKREVGLRFFLPVIEIF